MEPPQPQPPLSDRLCLCKDLHVDCSPDTCPQAPFADAFGYPSTTIAMLRESGEGRSMTYVWKADGEAGPRPACPTCAALARALTEVEEIAQTIKGTVKDLLQRDRKGWGSLDDRQAEWLEEDWEATYVELFAPRTAMSSGRRIIRTSPSKRFLEGQRHFNIWRDVSGKGGETIGCKALASLSCQALESTDDEAALGQLKMWIAKCDKRHGCVPAEGAPAPTRLVRVANDQVRVVKTGGEVLSYTTLSHRWGQDEQFKLLKATEAAMARDIPWDTIPKTFRDSMGLTRQLGIDYIWIDTICIMQDDPDDWKHEATRMKDVYSGSYLNIAASCSVGSHGGLYANRQTSGDFPIHTVPEPVENDAEDGLHPLRIQRQPNDTHTAYSSGDIDADDLSHSPLLSRGWILQERVLSPRMVYFDSQELKWECCSGSDCLCGGMLTKASFVVAYRTALGTRKRDASQPPLKQRYYYLPIRWMCIAERYSMCKLTFVADRVVALAGVAEQALLSNMPTGRYLAGAWERDLANQLCWQVLDTHHKPRDVYLAPSWSWLSVVGRLGFPNRNEDEMCNQHIAVEITEAECTLADETRPTGPITAGFIKVDGRALEFDVHLVDPGSVSEPQTFELTHRETGRTLDYKFKPDYVMPADSASCLSTVTLLYWGNMPPVVEVIMVLWHENENHRREGKFERLGLMAYDFRDDLFQEFNEVVDWFEPRKGLVIV